MLTKLLERFDPEQFRGRESPSDPVVPFEHDCVPNPEPRRGFTTEAQSSGAFDRATQLSSSKSHAEVRKQIVLVLVVVLVLEAPWHQLDRVCASASFRLLCRPPVLRRCASCDISSARDG